MWFTPMRGLPVADAMAAADVHETDRHENMPGPCVKLVMWRISCGRAKTGAQRHSRECINRGEVKLGLVESLTDHSRLH